MRFINTVVLLAFLPVCTATHARALTSDDIDILKSSFGIAEPGQPVAASSNCGIYRSAEATYTENDEKQDETTRANKLFNHFQFLGCLGTAVEYGVDYIPYDSAQWYCDKASRYSDYKSAYERMVTFTALPLPGKLAPYMPDGVTMVYRIMEGVAQKNCPLTRVAAHTPGKPAAAGQAVAEPGAAAGWGLTSEDLSVMDGIRIMDKVRMTERRAEILAAAKAGDALSQYLISASFQYGVGVNKDPVQKAEWASKASTRRLARAMSAYAIDKITGTGVQEDSLEGWILLLKATKVGNAIAQYNAAILTLRGRDMGNGYTVQYNYLEKPAALELLRSSAQAGLSLSQYALGHSYIEGSEFYGKDLALARFWLGKAAIQGLALAQTELANLPTE